LCADLLPDLAQPRDRVVQLRQLAPVDLQRSRAGVPGRVPGLEALDERADLLQPEAEVLQSPDLLKQSQMILVITPVAVSGALGPEQAA
jgi:hypothetical protein